MSDLKKDSFDMDVVMRFFAEELTSIVRNGVLLAINDCFGKKK